MKAFKDPVSPSNQPPAENYYYSLEAAPDPTNTARNEKKRKTDEGTRPRE